MARPNMVATVAGSVLAVLLLACPRQDVVQHDAAEVGETAGERRGDGGNISEIRNSPDTVVEHAGGADISHADLPSDESTEQSDTCAGDCNGKECGDDGCGGSCGECTEWRYCHNGVCDCQFGVCLPFDVPAEVCGGLELDWCEYWACVGSCCAVAAIPEEQCCVTGQDCRDCINLQSGDIAHCPDVVPDGYVENLCTIDDCHLKQCENWDKVANGFCDDEDSCTIDGCDPLTGECAYECDWDFQ